MATLKKLPSWERRVLHVIREHEGRAFVFGEHDCCLFAGKLIEAMTGFNPMHRFLGYRGAREAVLMIRRAGGLRGALIELFGAPVHPHTAKTGDIVLFNRHSVGVVVGPSALAASRIHGVDPIDRRFWREAFCLE